jgi:3-methyl-2-oxobutanoate hydroxymethyltransferase
VKIHDFSRKRREGLPITMVTCYDAWSAAIIADTEIDCILVGDSVAMVVHGHDTTLPANLEMMAMHTSAVRRGAPEAFVIGDLPFLSFRRGLAPAVDAAGALLRAGANAVKLEGARGNIELVHHLVESGIPIMGHLGLTPQSVHQLGGFRVQAKADAAAEQLLGDAKDLQRAGCFALVLEAIPAEVAKRVTEALDIPTIGIGAGPHVGGQVLVLHDLLGLTAAFRPRFVRTWLDGSELVRDALQSYHRDVIERRFPNGGESYR